MYSNKNSAMTESETMYPAPVAVDSSLQSAATVFFEFEADFVEDGVRCIPMIVRFKLDACGIKLKLHEWSKMSIAERAVLAAMACSSSKEIKQYRYYLQQLVVKNCGTAAADLPQHEDAVWAVVDSLPCVLLIKLAEFDWHISLWQWRSLSNLQRFVLLKLCRPGHENRNFPKAVKEFGLI
jgi:hypothetical protein